MSIMPKDGWGDPPPERNRKKPDLDLHPQGDYSAQPPDAPRRSYLTCKVCDRGTLRSMKVFRMSGPVVAIGYILLIPSICGIVLSAMFLMGVNLVGARPAKVPQLVNVKTPSNSDLWLRSPEAILHVCAMEAILKQDGIDYGHPDATVNGPIGVTPAQFRRIESYCQCTLDNVITEAKASAQTQTYSGVGPEPLSQADINHWFSGAQSVCTKMVRAHTLAPAVTKSARIYLDGLERIVPAGQPDSSRSENVGLGAFHAIGSGLAIFWAIASFVGGLLGWLLVMRKRVLQCDVCGAVVNAS
jgi:hypothetical protein